jgi:hypothetical protein
MLKGALGFAFGANRRRRQTTEWVYHRALVSAPLRAAAYGTEDFAAAADAAEAAVGLEQSHRPEESFADGTSSMIDGACIWGCSFRRGVALRIMRFLACIVHDSEVLRCCKTSSMARSLAALPPTVEESCQRAVSPFSASALRLRLLTSGDHGHDQKHGRRK